MTDQSSTPSSTPSTKTPPTSNAVHAQDKPYQGQPRYVPPPPRYLSQPIGIPDYLPLTIHEEKAGTVFNALVTAITRWDPRDSICGYYEDVRDMRELAEALAIVAEAHRAAMLPVVAAEQADQQAAEEFQRDRWFARSNPERAPLGARPTPAAAPAAAPDTRTSAEQAERRSAHRPWTADGDAEMGPATPVASNA